MNGILQNLLTLQGVDLCGQRHNASQAAALRAAIPPTMLQHYERLRARGEDERPLSLKQSCTSTSASGRGVKKESLWCATASARAAACRCPSPWSPRSCVEPSLRSAAIVAVIFACRIPPKPRSSTLLSPLILCPGRAKARSAPAERC